jgi:hypothetical protein
MDLSYEDNFTDCSSTVEGERGRGEAWEVEDDALFSFEADVVIPERDEWLQSSLALLMPIAATAAQRCWRGYAARRHFARLCAARRLLAIARGYAARLSACHLLEQAVAVRRRQALQGELKVPTTPNGSNAAKAGPTAAATDAHAEAEAATAREPLHVSRARAAALLQRSIRRIMPALRSRRRARQVRKVVKSAIAIQRVWRGFAARRRFSEDLRRRRWTRQLRQLAAELKEASAAPETFALRRLVAGATLQPMACDEATEPLEGYAIDPAVDAAYFRNLRAAPIPGGAVRRSNSWTRQQIFVTAPLHVVIKSVRAAEVAAEDADESSMRRRIRNALDAAHEQRSASRARSAIPQAVSRRKKVSAEAMVRRLYYGQPM